MNNLYDKEKFSDKYGFGEHKQEAIELLKKTIDILNEFDIKYFIISGTLLGYVRHKDIIPWDDDIDLMADKTIIEKLPAIYKKYKDELTFINKENFLIKTCNKKSSILIKDFYDKYLLNKDDKYYWPFIDIFIFYVHEEKNQIEFFQKLWDKTFFFPLRQVKFLNINVNIPFFPHYFLTFNYGENYLRTFVSSSYNHKKERGHGKVEKFILD